jgi:hypothetical protein
MAAAVTATAFDSAVNLDPPAEVNVTIAVATGDTYVVATYHQSGSDVGTITAFTFDGDAMSEVAGSPHSGADWSLRAYYIDVSAKSPGSYVCEVRHNLAPDDVTLCAYALAGAGAPTNWTEDSGAAATLIDIAVPGAADGLAIWAVRQDVDATLTPNGGETEVYDGQFSGAGVWYYASGFYKASTGSTTTSNIAMDAGNWEGVGLFIPTAGAAAPPNYGQRNDGQYLHDGATGTRALLNVKAWV